MNSRKILFIFFFSLLIGGFLYSDAWGALPNLGISCVGKYADYCKDNFPNENRKCNKDGRCLVPSVGGQPGDVGGQAGEVGGSPSEIGYIHDPDTYQFFSYAGETSAELICSVTNLISQTLLPPIAVLMALVVGFLFLTSQGEPQKITLATKVLYATLIGVFLLLVAPGIIALINDLFISDGVNLESPACGADITTSTIIQALLNLINLFAWFSAVVAVAMGLYSGFLYLTARGNPQQARQATLVFSYTIIGIAVSIVAFSIITIARQFIEL